MDNERLRQIITSRMKDATVMVVGDGGKFEVTVISKAFDGLSPVERHQLVYGTVDQEIANGTIHALSIRAHTEEENQTKP